MTTIPITIDKKNTLVVTGEKEDSSFIIHSITCISNDISDVLEWANSKPAGTILSVIEELVIEKL